IKMFGSGCSRVRSTRGSGTSSKKAKTPKYTGLSAFMLATKHRHRPNGKDSSVCQLKPIPQSKNKPTSAVQTYLSDGALALPFHPVDCSAGREAHDFQSRTVPASCHHLG